MAKKKSPPPLSLRNFDADLDSVLSSMDWADTPPDGTLDPIPEQPPTTAAETPAAIPSAPPTQQEKPRPKSRKAAPRKKKATGSPATDREVSHTLPPSSFTKEELGWFFSHSVDTSELKRIYVPESTKEVLQMIALSSKIPISHLTDNILRWFMVANKDEIRKIISRLRNSLDRLDG